MATITEEDLVARYQAGESAACTELLARLEPWLQRMAARFPLRKQALHEDLHQQGRLVLWRLARSYRPDRGCRFRNYAYRRVLGEMQDYLRGEGVIRLHRRAFKTHSQLWRAQSLDTVLNIPNNTRAASPATFLVDDSQPPPEALAMDGEELDALYRALGRLPTRAARIAMYRLDGCTLAEIAARVGLSESRVSQQLPAILAALQALLRAQRLERPWPADEPLTADEIAYLCLAHREFPPEVLADHLQRPAAVTREFCHQPTLARRHALSRLSAPPAAIS